MHIHCKKNYQGVCEVSLLQGHDAALLGALFPVFLRQQCGLIFLDAATVEDTTTVALKLKDLNAQRLLCLIQELVPHPHCCKNLKTCKNCNYYC